MAKLNESYSYIPIPIPMPSHSPSTRTGPIRCHCYRPTGGQVSLGFFFVAPRCIVNNIQGDTCAAIPLRSQGVYLICARLQQNQSLSHELSEQVTFIFVLLHSSFEYHANINSSPGKGYILRGIQPFTIPLLFMYFPDFFLCFAAFPLFQLFQLSFARFAAAADAAALTLGPLNWLQVQYFDLQLFRSGRATRSFFSVLIGRFFLYFARIVSQILSSQDICMHCERTKPKLISIVRSDIIFSTVAAACCWRCCNCNFRCSCWRCAIPKGLPDCPTFAGDSHGLPMHNAYKLHYNQPGQTWKYI